MLCFLLLISMKSATKINCSRKYDLALRKRKKKKRNARKKKKGQEKAKHERRPRRTVQHAKLAIICPASLPCAPSANYAARVPPFAHRVAYKPD
jgi:hypothetical protein